MITAPLVAAAHSAVVAAEEVEEVNPLLPHTYDIVWSLVIVVIIAVVFIKYALPKFQAVLDERAEKIEGGLQHAETAQAEAAELRAEYEQQLADARTEAARIKEAARAEGGAIVTELKAKATAEAARTVETAQRQIEAERQQAAVSLRNDVGCARHRARLEDRRRVPRGHRPPVAGRRPVPRGARGERDRDHERRQGELMRGTSLASLGAAQHRFEPVLSAAGAQAITLGEQLFAVVDALDSSGSLRRTLSDPAIDGDAKAGLVVERARPARRPRRRRGVGPRAGALVVRRRPHRGRRAPRLRRRARVGAGRQASSSASRTSCSASRGRSSASARCARRCSTRGSPATSGRTSRRTCCAARSPTPPSRWPGGRPPSPARSALRRDARPRRRPRRGTARAPRGVRDLRQRALAGAAGPPRRHPAAGVRAGRCSST